MCGLIWDGSVQLGTSKVHDMEPFIRHHDPVAVLSTKTTTRLLDGDVPSLVLSCSVSAGEVLHIKYIYIAPSIDLALIRCVLRLSSGSGIWKCCHRGSQSLLPPDSGTHC